VQTSTVIPEEVSAYGSAVAAGLDAALAGGVLGTYFTGSVALGDYEPVVSDIDIVAVTATPPSAAELAGVVDRLAHPTLPCPARGLELVLYDRRSTSVATDGAAFALNLNTGPRMATQVDLTADRDRVPAFWFVIDRAVVARHGCTIRGPEPQELFAPLPRSWTLRAMGESIAMTRMGLVTGSTVLNACRAWRFAALDVLGSKDDGAVWAKARFDDPALIDRARRRRHASLDAPRARVERLLDHAAHAVWTAVATAS
jgi:hypothetical protein